MPDDPAHALAALAVRAGRDLPEEIRDAVRDAIATGAAPADVVRALLAADGEADVADVGRADDLEPGQVRTAHAFGIRLAVGNRDGQLFAIEGTCPHANGPLDDGRLTDRTLTCPIHGFDFDVLTGNCLTDARHSVRTFAVERRGDRIVVRR